MRYLLPILIMLAAGSASAFSLLGRDASEAPKAVPQNQADITLSFAPIVKKTAPAVVNIYTLKKVVRQHRLFADPFFEQLFGGQFGLGVPRARLENSLGSGVIIAPQGKVITSYHVVEGAEDIMVVLHDRREYRARMVRSDPEADLALLQIEEEEEPFTALKIRNSDALEVGDLVLALGNPFGVGQTVTSGIISAEGRPVTTNGMQHYFLQTDAAINPGNSGGALVDMAGRLVGINTAIFSKSGGSHGIGFAIPSNIVASFLNRQVNEAGRVVKPWFGARFVAVTRDVANALGLKTPSGVLVKDLYEGSPAKRSGMRAGDVIIRAAGREISSIESLRYVLNTSAIGTQLSVAVWRGGEEVALRMPLIAPPETPQRDVRHLRGNHPFNRVRVANLNPALASELDLPYQPNRVVVLNDNAYLQAGDLVIVVNAEAIDSTRQLEALLKTPAPRYALKLLRGGQRINVIVR